MTWVFPTLYEYWQQGSKQAIEKTEDDGRVQFVSVILV